MLKAPSGGSGIDLDGARVKSNGKLAGSRDVTVLATERAMAVPLEERGNGAENDTSPKRTNPTHLSRVTGKQTSLASLALAQAKEQEKGQTDAGNLGFAQSNAGGSASQESLPSKTNMASTPAAIRGDADSPADGKLMRMASLDAWLDEFTGASVKDDESTEDEAEDLPPRKTVKGPSRALKPVPVPAHARASIKRETLDQDGKSSRPQPEVGKLATGEPGELCSQKLAPNVKAEDS